MAKIDVKFLISRLDESQKNALHIILKKLQNKQVLKQADVGLLGYDFSRARHKEAAEFFHISNRQLYHWIDDGCPQNEDKTFDFYKIHKWLLEKENDSDENSLKDQKLEEEIKKLRILNTKLQEQYIDRAEHEAILSARAVSLRNFIERSLSLNRAQRAMKSVEELAAVEHELCRLMMEAYTGRKE